MVISKFFLFTTLLLVGCAAPQQTMTQQDAAVSALAAPVRVFSIGYWDKQTMILILVDTQQHYLTIRAKRDDRLKTGATYRK